MATTIVDWLNDGTIPQNKASGAWTPSDFNTGKFRFTLTFTNASTHSQWRPASLTFWGILTTNDANGAAIWMEWDPGGSTHKILFVASDGSTILGSMTITWGASSAVTIATDQSSATAGASTMTISGASTGNGTSSGWTRASVFSGSNLYFGAWGGGGFQLPAGSTTTSDIDDAVDGVSGTLASTLGALAVAATGNPEVNGDVTATLGALTVSATGSTESTGTLDVTLGELTATGSGTVDVNGALTATLGELTVAAENGQLSLDAVLGALTVVAEGTVGEESGEVTGMLDATLGALTVVAEGDAEVNGTLDATLGALTSSASGSVEVSGSVNATLGELTVIANNAAGLQRGDYGAARELFGSAATSVTVTLSTQSGSLILVCTGGNLTDLANAPTDNQGNTYTALGSAEEFDDWPGYGVRLWHCIGANGGVNHQITQVMTQFDESTICAVEIINGGVVVDFGINEVANGNALTMLPVDTSGPAELIAFWSGDAPTGATADISASNDYEILDETTLVDHPNGYVPIAILGRSASDPSSYTTTVTESPDQGAIMANVAVQVVAGIIGSAAASLGALTVAAAGNAEVTGSADATLGALTVAATGAVDVNGAVDATLGALTAAATGSVESTGAADVTLGELTLVATGLASENNVLDATLGALTVAAEGSVDVSGSLDVTLGSLVASAAGSVEVNGAVSATLATLTVSASGSIGAIEPIPDDFRVDHSTSRFGATLATRRFGVRRGG